MVTSDDDSQKVSEVPNADETAQRGGQAGRPRPLFSHPVFLVPAWVHREGWHGL